MHQCLFTNRGKCSEGKGMLLQELVHQKPDFGLKVMSGETILWAAHVSRASEGPGRRVMQIGQRVLGPCGG
uniref:Uncharacterized protein n=1 Tax=Cercocebus atys TaxID=9531 RepID=A0A2K5KMD1_CERAT